MADRTLFLVFTDPVEGKEDEYNEWYDSKHLPDVVATPGIVAAQRYDLAEVDATAGQAPTRYLAVYELDDDPASVMQRFMDRLGEGKLDISPTLDQSKLAMTMWQPRGDRLEE